MRQEIQKFRYYSCRRAKARGKEACDAPNIPAGDLEQLAADALVNVYSDTDLFERAIEAYLAQCAERSAPAAEELAATETALQGKQRVRRRYQADYERGDLDARTYSARARELDTEIDTLRDRAEALRAQATPPTVPSTPNAGRLASMRAALTQGITEGAIEERKELVTILVERITINDLDDIQPVFRLLDPDSFIGAPATGNVGGDSPEGGVERFAYRQTKWWCRKCEPELGRTMAGRWTRERSRGGTAPIAAHR